MSLKLYLLFQLIIIFQTNIVTGEEIPCPEIGDNNKINITKDFLTFFDWSFNNMADYSISIQRALEIDVNNTKKSYENKNNNVESKQLICYNSLENKITTIHEECQSIIKICTQKNFNKYHHCRNTNFSKKRQTRSVEISVIEEKLFNKTGWNKKIIDFVDFCAGVSQSQTNCLSEAVANFNEKINLAKNISNDCIKTLSHWNPPYAKLNY